MSPAVFVHELAEMAPSVAELQAVVLGADEAGRWVSAYHLAPRAQPLSLEFPFHDEVLALVRTYEVGGLEVGMVTFLDCPRPLPNGVQVAVVELDLLLLTEAGEVVVVDGECPDHVMWRCAADGGRFLQALSLANRFLTSRVVDHDLLEDDPYALGVGRSVGTAAGGSEYEAFYQMLFGV